MPGIVNRLLRRLGRSPQLAVSEARGIRTLHLGGETDSHLLVPIIP